MPIKTITNATNAQLELWDVGTQLAILDNGQSVHTIPVTITSVTRAEVGYHNKRGSFQNDDSYQATFIPANPPQPATVLFSGHKGNVSFT